MEFKKEPTDEQLDELLRDVVIPSDLKSQLNQIPLEQNLDSSQTTVTSQTPDSIDKTNSSWIAFVLAASLIGIGLFVSFQFWPANDNAGVPSEIANNDKPKTEIGVKSPESQEFENQLAEFMDGQQQLDAALHAIEVAQMETQLAKLEQSAAAQLDQREVESMIAAMAEEYSIPFGTSQKQVQLRMAQVIKDYPGTRGAEIAHQFLNQNTN